MTTTLRDLERIETAHLYQPLLHELIALLRGLSADDWHKPTLAPRWRVRDIAAHLLDGDLRRLSLARDGHTMSTGPITGYRDVLALITDLNATGGSFAARLSPAVMVDLLAVTGEWVAAYFGQLDPDDQAVFTVDWAGEARSTNWMDMARDYTERWHHQMQIRHAVNAPFTLLEPRWVTPLLETSVRALPAAYRDLDAMDGTTIVFAVEGASSQAWTLVREGDRWRLKAGRAAEPAASVTAHADTAWRLFYNALPIDEARVRVRIDGDATLVEPMLRARSVMV